MWPSALSSRLWGQTAQPPTHVQTYLLTADFQHMLPTLVVSDTTQHKCKQPELLSSSGWEWKQFKNKYKPPPPKYAVHKISLQERMPTLFLYRPDGILNTQQKRKSEFNMK